MLPTYTRNDIVFSLIVFYASSAQTQMLSSPPITVDGLIMWRAFLPVAAAHVKTPVLYTRPLAWKLLADLRLLCVHDELSR